MTMLRTWLDRLYLAGGVIGALCLIVILLIICGQMIARWTGIAFPGSTNYAGYFMAASTFFALAYALNEGSHIRVTLILGHMGRFRRWGEIWCYAVAALITTFFAWHAIHRNLQTQKFNFLSQGQDATPLWIPELAMTLGSILLAIALWDHLIRMLFGSHAGVKQQDITEREH